MEINLPRDDEGAQAIDLLACSPPHAVGDGTYQGQTGPYGHTDREQIVVVVCVPIFGVGLV